MNAKEPLSVTHPELATEAHGWDPSAVTAGSSKKLLWRCPTNHVWICEVRSRTGYKNSKKSCTECSSLEYQFPKIAKQAYGWDPSKYSIGSSKTFPWKCDKGHIWETRIIHRTSSGTGCPFCWGRFPIIGETDLAFTHPEIAALAHGWDPAKVTAGSEKKMEWVCALGHVWTAQVFALLHGNRCPYCTNNKVLVGFNDLLTTHPEVASETTLEHSQSVTAGSKKVLEWRCALGHKYKAPVNSRTSKRRVTGCPVCAGKKVVIGFNDLYFTHPILATEAFEWDPKSLTSGSNKKVRWKCSLGHVWSATINSRALAGNGCPTCALSGFDPNSDAWLYFLTHPNWQMLQIGITNFPTDRLRNHKRLGWAVIELRGPMDGFIARAWETSILQMLKRRSAKLAIEAVAGKFDGYTEAWLEDSFPVGSLNELMNFVRKDED